MAMYKIAPVLQQYSIEDKEIMYKVAPIQSIAQADAAPVDLEVVESQQNELFDKLNSLRWNKATSNSSHQPSLAREWTQ